MDDDDLLDENLEQDLRYQLQRGGGRGRGEADRGGYKGRRIEGYGGRGAAQEDRERFGGGAGISIQAEVSLGGVNIREVAGMMRSRGLGSTISRESGISSKETGIAKTGVSIRTIGRKGIETEVVLGLLKV